MLYQPAARLGAIVAALSLAVTTDARAEGAAAESPPSVAATAIAERDKRQVPFTKVDIALLLAGGGGLVAAGAGVRRVGRERSS